MRILTFAMLSGLCVSGILVTHQATTAQSIPLSSSNFSELQLINIYNSSGTNNPYRGSGRGSGRREILASPPVSLGITEV